MTNDIECFQQTVRDYYAQHARVLPWRKLNYPEQEIAYQVLVSEFMLQQTQVPRVIEKYETWLAAYPRLSDVARADFADILAHWNGLGYNRRARFLFEACKLIQNDYIGIIPHDIKTLQSIKGIGYNTAAAIIVYAYNKPIAFIETNIRTVFIYHFFQNQEPVADSQLLPLVDSTMDKTNPREWFWALMDYGSYIKKHIDNVGKKSKHYVKQSSFKGSKRQLRGTILKLLINGEKSYKELRFLCENDNRLNSVLLELEKEKLLTKTGVLYTLPRT